MALTQSATSSMTMAADSQTLNTSSTSLPSAPTLPPPQLFDILPALHELLARIDHTPSSNNDNPLQLSSSRESEDRDIGAHYQEQAPLEPKDLPTEVLAIKAKIRKALREVERLPDMECSVEEQEEEIAELEARIERQRGMLRRFGSMGRGVVGSASVSG